MPNRLAAATSPYLRQHADNPVDWWPWCDEALATARRDNKPILLSIGYSACHWCHVMAHESFEDETTARAMNARFVNIKIDREERPDLDKIYQLAHQALVRRGGGWPLTVFLTPDDLLPFYAGTYFPNSPRHNMPSFMQVLQGVRRWYNEKPDDVRAQNASLAAFLRDHDAHAAHADALDATPIADAFKRIAEQFDADNGGHRGAPKFPHAQEIEFLLRRARGDEAIAKAAATMARTTLACMAERGLRDHLGGGFFRYTIDAEWDIPHFEKMLYDNAQLLPLYAQGAKAFAHDTGTNAMFAAAARDCADWLRREMTAPGGALMSSLDADSEGEEGRFYVWQRDEIRATLDAREFAFAESRFGLDRAPNFEGQAWHLRAVAPIEDVTAALGISPIEAQALWRSARTKLLAARAQRVRPGLDDKILTAWNALAIAGMARALRALPEPGDLRAAAEHALDFLHAQLWRDGRLYAVHARGETRIAAFLDDHAFLLDALLAMLQVRWLRRDLDFAIAIAEALLARFEDRENGGFFFTANDGENLPQRPKPWLDESVPCGNGVAARALLKLGHLLGETRYLDAGERTLRAGWHALRNHPEACSTLLFALDDFLSPSTHVVLRADDGDEAERWDAALESLCDDSADVYRIAANEFALPGTLAAQTHARGGVAYVCRGTSCDAPITDPADLAQ